MLDLLAEATKRTLELDGDILQVFSEPPEGVSDYPSAIVMEINGAVARDGYRGLWEPMVEIRVWLLVMPRRQLPEAVGETRKWVKRLVGLFAQNDELLDDEGDTIADIEDIGWKMGTLPWAKIDHSGIELTLRARMELQTLVGC